VTYVRGLGTHTYPYTNWTTAATNIQSAVDTVADDGTVWVTNGTYVLSAQIQGGKTRFPAERERAAATKVDGNRADRCFYLMHAGAVADGFTLVNGSSGTGGGAYCANGATLQNSVICSNEATDLHGGGVMISYQGHRAELPRFRRTRPRTRAGHLLRPWRARGELHRERQLC